MRGVALSKIPYIWTGFFFPFRGMMLSGTLSVACGFLFALVWFAVCALNALQAGLCSSCKLPETMSERVSSQQAYALGPIQQHKATTPLKLIRLFLIYFVLSHSELSIGRLVEYDKCTSLHCCRMRLLLVIVWAMLRSIDLSMTKPIKLRPPAWLGLAMGAKQLESIGLIGLNRRG